MLLLTRRKGESIIIGNDIEVTLIELKGKQARIGICAPNEIAILREEVYEKIYQKKFNRFKKRASVMTNLYLNECNHE